MPPEVVVDPPRKAVIWRVICDCGWKSLYRWLPRQGKNCPRCGGVPTLVPEEWDIPAESEQDVG
jgi:D-serine deaminase-like pyridoxal phosphate-dependent protein